MPTPLLSNPFEWFDLWYRDALASAMTDPNAMSLATVDAQGRPSLRVVLLKEWDEDGFVFYTNLRSKKGRDLAENPAAALNFFWRDLRRQIRIEGQAEQVSDAQADAYFATRPRGSQIGAWASQQSQPIADRDSLLKAYERIEKKYEGKPIPRPPHWSGIRIKPRRIEFWSCGEFRLHDRWVFERENFDEDWNLARLSP